MSSTFLTVIVLPYINIGVESAAEWASSVWRESGSARAEAAVPSASS